MMNQSVSNFKFSKPKFVQNGGELDWLCPYLQIIYCYASYVNNVLYTPNLQIKRLKKKNIKPKIPKRLKKKKPLNYI